jgi:hypothetical protein
VCRYSFILLWGSFINSLNIVGGNLENSVMQNCQYYNAVGFSSTLLAFVNNTYNIFSIISYDMICK